MRSSCIADQLGRGWIAVALRARLPPSGGAGEVELCLAHPLGLTEVAHGRVGGSIRLRTREDGAVVRTRTGSAVTAL